MDENVVSLIWLCIMSCSIQEICGFQKLEIWASLCRPQNEGMRVCFVNASTCVTCCHMEQNQIWRRGTYVLGVYDCELGLGQIASLECR